MKFRAHPLMLKTTCRPNPMARWTLIILMAVLAGWSLLRWQEIGGLNAELSAQQEKKEEMTFLLEQRQQNPAAKANDGQSTVLRKIELQLSAPWQSLLAALDRAARPSVNLLSLSPDAANGQVKLTIEAHTLEQALQYVERLEAQPELANVYLVSQQPAQQTAGIPVAPLSNINTEKLHFVLQADWRQP